MNDIDVRLVVSIVLGLVTSVLLSSANTLTARLSSVTAGLFCAIFATPAVIDWAGLNSDIYTYTVAGLLAMSGDRLVRRLFQVIELLELPWRQK